MSVDPSQMNGLSSDFGLQGMGPPDLSAFGAPPTQPLIQSQPNAGAQQPVAGQPAPQQSPQPPQQDPMKQIMSDLTRLLKSQPSFTPPDTSAQDAEMAAGKKRAQTAETNLENIDQQAAAMDQAQAAQMQQYDAQLDQLMQKYPTEQVGYAAAMHAAPMIALLATLGGKAAGLSGQAMLGALNGMMTGLNQGAQDQFQQSLEKWKQELANLKDRNERQKEIYAVMLDAYKNRADAAQKARDFALTMTDDAFSQKEAAIKDKINIFDAREKQFQATAQVTSLFDRLQMQQSGGGSLTPQVRALDAALTSAGVTIPGAGRGGQLYYQKLNDLIAQNPTASPQQLAQQVKEGTLDMKAAGTETTVAARKEASIGAAQEALNAPGGIWDQVDAAAKKVDFGSAKFKNNFDLALQGKAVADKDIQSYVTTIQEARAELSQVYARNGQTTDAARRMAEDALPLAASYEELQAAKQASIKGSQAVRAGNQRYMDQAAGRTPADTGTAPGRTVVKTGTQHMPDGTTRRVVQYSDGSLSFQ
jgi:hypothetical protein